MLFGNPSILFNQKLINFTLLSIISLKSTDNNLVHGLVVINMYRPQISDEQCNVLCHKFIDITLISYRNVCLVLDQSLELSIKPLPCRLKITVLVSIIVSKVVDFGSFCIDFAYLDNSCSNLFA